MAVGASLRRCGPRIQTFDVFVSHQNLVEHRPCERASQPPSTSVIDDDSRRPRRGRRCVAARRVADRSIAPGSESLFLPSVATRRGRCRSSSRAICAQVERRLRPEAHVLGHADARSTSEHEGTRGRRTSPSNALGRPERALPCEQPVEDEVTLVRLGTTERSSPCRRDRLAVRTVHRRTTSSPGAGTPCRHSRAPRGVPASRWLAMVVRSPVLTHSPPPASRSSSTRLGFSQGRLRLAQLCERGLDVDGLRGRTSR